MFDCNGWGGKKLQYIIRKVMSGGYENDSENAVTHIIRRTILKGVVPIFPELMRGFQEK